GANRTRSLWPRRWVFKPCAITIRIETRLRCGCTFRRIRIPFKHLPGIEEEGGRSASHRPRVQRRKQWLRRRQGAIESEITVEVAAYDHYCENAVCFSDRGRGIQCSRGYRQQCEGASHPVHSSHA